MRHPVEQLTKEPLPAHSLDLLKDIRDIFADPEAWLQMPNVRLGGRKPIDLIGTPEEVHVRNITESIKYGLFA
jgi:uncharacterized protein (DUF2384 family)